MKNDFHLFGDHADPSLDADVALIAAYVARELSTVQIMALQERLASDTAFRTMMQQVIDGWVVPGERSAIRAAMPATSLSGDEIEEGWQRHLASRGSGSTAAAPAQVARPVGRRPWIVNRMLRAAAVIGMIVLPILAIAQLVQFGRDPGRGTSGTTTGALTGQDAGAPPAVRVNEGRPSQALPLSELEPVLPPDQQQPGGPAPHALGAVDARSSVTFALPDWYAVLNGDRVIVGDGRRRQLVLLDDDLQPVRTVLDSVPGQPNSYNCSVPRGAMGGGTGSGSMADLVDSSPWVGPTMRIYCFVAPFRGDSALWFDPNAGVATVIARDGSRSRKLPLPIGFVEHGIAGTHIVSPSGFIWRSKGYRTSREPVPPGVTLRVPDSGVMLRMNYDTRHVDTVARIELGTVSHRTATSAGNGKASVFPFQDHIVATPDGSIVIFHAREFRFDWLLPDGRLVPGPRLQNPSRPLTAARRQQLIDSINSSRQRRYDSLLAVRPVPPPTLSLVTQEDIPDVLPAVGGMHAGLDGRVWINMAPLVAPSEIWQIARAAGVVDRVRLGAGEPGWIIGYGTGVIYRIAQDGGEYRIERVRIR
jgi:hypothetical protein